MTASHTSPYRTSLVRTMISLSVSALMLFAFALPAGASSHEGTVTVVHGVPDLTVDVYVNGDLTLEDFAPGTVTDPLTLPAGDYELAVRPADADPSSDPAISGSATLPGGANASVVAHLDEAGAPMLSVFVNDTSAIDAGQARVTVRHTAAAPTVDVLADGAVLVPGLSNPDEASAAVPAGTYSVSVAPTGTTDAVLGPVDLDLSEGTGYFVYAIGSAEAGNLDLLVQTISGLHSAPSGVPAGSGGLATDAMPLWVLALSGAAALTAVGAGTQLARARS